MRPPLISGVRHECRAADEHTRSNRRGCREVSRYPNTSRARISEASEAQSGASVEFDGKSEILEVKVLGGWAYILTKLGVAATQPGNEPTVRSGHTLTILRKDAGNWKIARDANLLVPVSAPEGGA